MNEEKTINEQELDKVAGGAGGEVDAFDAVWDAFAETHCRYDCGVPSPLICDAEIQRVRAQWEAGQPLKCAAYMSRC